MPAISYHRDTVLGTSIFEQPGSLHFEGETAITRTFRIEAVTRPLTLVLDEIVDGFNSTATEHRAVVKHVSAGLILFIKSLSP